MFCSVVLLGESTLRIFRLRREDWSESLTVSSLIRYERRSADRPAGIRTMGLVSLGACSFTISSIMAFKSSTMGWDASRVTAALPSGVGFLGGALIWKGSVFIDDEEIHQVNGLTTAASVWLSAAVGVGCGGALYLVTGYVVILVVMILRYAPRSYLKGLTDMSDNIDDGEDRPDEPQKEDRPLPNRDSQLEGNRTSPLVDSDRKDIEEVDDSVLDAIPPKRASSRVVSCRIPLIKKHSSSSKRMIKSKSTGSLRASLRAHLPTFGD